MENIRKGICINVENKCSQAINKVVQEIPVAADFLCSECERDLIPIKEKKTKWKKLVIIVLPILIIVALLYFLIPKSPKGPPLPINQKDSSSKNEDSTGKVGSSKAVTPVNDSSQTRDNIKKNSSDAPTVRHFPNRGTFTGKYQTKNGVKYRIMNDGNGGFYYMKVNNQDPEKEEINIGGNPDSVQKQNKQNP